MNQMVQIKKLFWVFFFVMAVGLPSVHAADENGQESINSENPEESYVPGSGIWACLKDMVCEPFRMIHDDYKAIGFMINGDEEGAREWVLSGEAWSNFSKGVHAYNLNHLEDSFAEKGLGFGKEMAAGFIMMPWEMKEAIQEGDYEKAEYLGTSILITVTPAAYGLRNVSLTLPKNSIRYVPFQMGENQMALAAVATQAITIEGFIIHEGAVIGIFMRPNYEPPSDYEKPIRWVQDGPHSKSGEWQYEDGRPVPSNHPGLREGRSHTETGTMQSKQIKKSAPELEFISTKEFEEAWSRYGNLRSKIANEGEGALTTEGLIEFKALEDRLFKYCRKQGYMFFRLY